MSRINFAAIDIGSNAVRLLIKSISSDATDKQQFKKILLLRVPLRLGFDIFKDGELSERKARKLHRLIKAYRQLMKIYDVKYYRACATSAMRDARGGAEIIQKITDDTHINIEIINGSEEARIIYSNHLECMADRHGAYLYVDVGGGSTEINFLIEGRLQSSVSYDIGTVRYLTGKIRDDEWLRMENDLKEIALENDHINIIGSGGNINKIYRMANDKNSVDKSISIETVRSLYNKLHALSVEERINEYALKDDRADVIVPAAEIFLRIADMVHAQYIHVPVIGLADGIIDELYEKVCEEKKSRFKTTMTIPKN